MKIATAVFLRLLAGLMFLACLATAPDVALRAVGVLLACAVCWDIARSLEGQDGLVVITEYRKELP